MSRKAFPALFGFKGQSDSTTGSPMVKSPSKRALLNAVGCHGRCSSRNHDH